MSDAYSIRPANVAADAPFNARLIARADEVDNRIGPVPGHVADQLATELRAAADRIAELEAALTKAITVIDGRVQRETSGRDSDNGWMKDAWLREFRAVLGPLPAKTEGKTGR